MIRNRRPAGLAIPLLPALFAAGALILLAPTTHAAPPTQTRTIQVRVEYTEPTPKFDGVECRGLGAPSPWCKAVLTGPLTFTGTIAGKAWAESAGPTPDGHTYEGPVTFEHAVVEGCGEGGLILDLFEGDFDFAGTRPGDLSTGFGNKWRIRAGSGTGTLAGISGHGETKGRTYWIESGESRGVFTGTITCQVPTKSGR